MNIGTGAGTMEQDYFCLRSRPGDPDVVRSFVCGLVEMNDPNDPKDMNDTIATIDMIDLINLINPIDRMTGCFADD